MLIRCREIRIKDALGKGGGPNKGADVLTGAQAVAYGEEKDVVQAEVQVCVSPSLVVGMQVVAQVEQLVGGKAEARFAMEVGTSVETPYFVHTC